MFLTVAVPLARRGFLSAAVLVFAHTVGEFGVVLMIGGGIPGKTEVLSIRMYQLVEQLQFGEAAKLAGGPGRVQLRRPPDPVPPRTPRHPRDPVNPDAQGLVCRLAGRVGELSLAAAFVAPAGVVTALTGDSASGKTTLLRAIAGLHRLKGEVSLDEEVWQDRRRFIPPHERSVGFVFQEAALLPHLNVAQNLAYAARRSGADQGEIADTADLLGVDRLLDRRVRSLSGGERRRVALARALLTRPRLLLLDEPLSGLDAAGKAALTPRLAEVFSRLAIPVVLVSHDSQEIDRLASRVLVLRDGRIEGPSPGGAA